MWAVSFSFSSLIASASLSNRRNTGVPRLSASFFRYPLASKIMVRNLPYSTSEKTLQKEFSAFGEIAKVKLIKNESTNWSKGYAFIQYTSQDDAMLALESMDQKMYDGKMIYVDIVKPGRHDFGGYPRTSGPPENPGLLERDAEVADCWY